MKKITLILAMMMVVLSAMADGPKYSFFGGGDAFNNNAKPRSITDEDFNHNESFDINYNSNSAGTAAINYDAINNSQTPRSIFRFGMGENGSNSSSIGTGSVSSSRGVGLGGGHAAATGSGTALSGALYGGKQGNDITLGQNGHLALFGEEIDVMANGGWHGHGHGGHGHHNGAQGETPFPLGDANAPMLMAIMALAWVVIRRFRK